MVDHVPTRQRLLEQDIDVIEAEGESAMRVHAIAAASGVTVPSVYHFFRSKEGLIEVAQAERYVRALRESNDTFVMALADCRDAASFRQLCEVRVMGFCDEEGAHRRLVRLNALGTAYARPDLLEAINHSQTSAIEALAEGMGVAPERGSIRSEVDPRALTAWMMGTMLGRALIELGPNPVDPEQWNAIFFEALFAVVFGGDVGGAVDGAR